MQDLQIEDLLRGIETGNFTPKVGSQFGSHWGLDGLMAREASSEEYEASSAFGAGPKAKLCHGWPVNWLGQQWSAILMYPRETLAQINIHTEPNESAFTSVCARLTTLFGSGNKIDLPQDALQSIVSRFAWYSHGGSVVLVRTPTYIQLSIATVDDSPTSSGCFGLVVMIAVALSLAAWLS